MPIEIPCPTRAAAKIKQDLIRITLACYDQHLELMSAGYDLILPQHELKLDENDPYRS
jgi:hypothetical protein